MKRFLKILHKKGKERSGFTLVEILIVVAVIGIVMGIAIPRSIQAGKNTRVKEGLKLLKDIQIHYVLKSVQGEPPDAPVATDAGLLTWGIHV